MLLIFLVILIHNENMDKFLKRKKTCVRRNVSKSLRVKQTKNKKTNQYVDEIYSVRKI